jgi:hypothetical protein
MKRNTLKVLQLSANQSLPAQTLRAMRRFESDKQPNTAMTPPDFSLLALISLAFRDTKKAQWYIWQHTQ